MFSLGGWRGMDWRENITVQNCGRALVKPKNQPGGTVLAPQCLKWSTINSVDVWAAQRSSNTGYSQCLNPPFEPFTSPWIHPCYNQPRVSRPKFRMETNSTVVWLYAGGVSLMCDLEWFPKIRSHFILVCWICMASIMLNKLMCCATSKNQGHPALLWLITHASILHTIYCNNVFKFVL